MPGGGGLAGAVPGRSGRRELRHRRRVAKLSVEEFSGSRAENAAEVLWERARVSDGPGATRPATVYNTGLTDAGCTEFAGNNATYLGDIPLAVDLRLHDIERVEVLLGP